MHPRRLALLAVAAATLAAVQCRTPAPARADALESVVMLSRPEGRGRVMGSGSTVAEDQHYYWVLTNAHVAGSKPGQAVDCVFFRRGYASKAIAGQVVWAAYQGQTDAALVAVPKAPLGAVGPMLADLSPAAVATGDTIISAGCPEGAWPNEFRGHVVRTQGNLIYFTPQPKQGRSGSAVYDRQGRLVGLVTWADPDANMGLAQTWASVKATYQGAGLSAAPPPAAAEPCGIITVPYVKESHAIELQCPGPYCPSPPFRGGSMAPPMPQAPMAPQAPAVQPSDPWPGMPPLDQEESKQDKDRRRGLLPFRGDREKDKPVAPTAPIQPPPPAPQAAPPQLPPTDSTQSGILRPDTAELKKTIAEAAGEAAAKARDALAPSIAAAADDATKKAQAVIAPALDQVQKAAEKVDALNDQWSRTNDTIQSAERKVWPVVLTIAGAILARIVLPRVLSRYFGPDESAKVLEELKGLLKGLRPKPTKPTPPPPPTDQEEDA